MIWKHQNLEVLYCHQLFFFFLSFSYLFLHLWQFNMCHSMTKRIQIFLHDNQTVEADLIRSPYLAHSQNPWTNKDWNLIVKRKKLRDEWGKNVKGETNFVACASRLNNDYQQSIFYVSVSEEEARFKTPQRLLLPLWCVSQVEFDLINNEIGFKTNIWSTKKY